MKMVMRSEVKGGGRVCDRPRYDWMEVVKVALNSRGVTMEDSLHL